MPPQKKTATEAAPEALLPVGATVNLHFGGRQLPNYTVLAYDDKLVKFKTHPMAAPSSDEVLIPWARIDGIEIV